MSERTLRNILIVGTLLFLLILGAMTVDSLSQVASARTAQLTDQVVAGKQVWQSKNCNDCHTILGIGGYYAPELTKTFDRRGAAWLNAFLKDPQQVLPQTTMPNQNLTDAQVGNLVAFFQWVSLVDTNNWPPQPLTKSSLPASQSVNAGNAAPALSGVTVFQGKGCSACHVVNGQGGQSGPDLSHIASQPYDALPNTPEFLAKLLKTRERKSGCVDACHSHEFGRAGHACPISVNAQVKETLR
jgi:nitric oxide reductase subunit C